MQDHVYENQKMQNALNIYSYVIWVAHDRSYNTVELCNLAQDQFLIWARSCQISKSHFPAIVLMKKFIETFKLPGRWNTDAKTWRVVVWAPRELHPKRKNQFLWIRVSCDTADLICCFVATERFYWLNNLGGERRLAASSHRARGTMQSISFRKVHWWAYDSSIPHSNKLPQCMNSHHFPFHFKFALLWILLVQQFSYSFA